MSSIPLDDPEKFDLWLRERWTDKDELMELYMQTGRFPPDKAAPNDGFIETEVQQKHWWEFTQIFVGLGAFGLIVNLLVKLWTLVFHAPAVGKG